LAASSVDVRSARFRTDVRDPSVVRNWVTLTRQIDEHIATAGFEIDKMDTYYLEGEPRPMGYTYEGRAVRR
jgi:hypothetical protein